MVIFIFIGEYQIKFIVANNRGVSTNVNTDDVNHPCSVEIRDECGRIRKTIMGKLYTKDNIEGFSFDYLT